MSTSLATKEVLTTVEASRLMNITMGAVHQAIKMRKLKATFHKKWFIKKEDLIEYQNNKYSRDKSLYKGKPLFSEEKGEFSVGKLSKMLNIETQRLYYLLRKGKIFSTRKGASWVIPKEEIQTIKELEQARKIKAKKKK